jgi:hypothetical protein
MILRDIVLRIRDTCPIFERRVYGSAQLEEGLREAENLPVPTAFVMVDGDSPAADQNSAGTLQETQERWTVVVVVSNKDDARGQAASDSIHIILRSLLNWENSPDRDENDALNTDNDWGKIVYRGGLHIDMSAARLWHQFSFGHNIVLSAGTEYETIPALAEAARAELEVGYRGGPTGTMHDDTPYEDIISGKALTIGELPAFKRPDTRPPARPRRPPHFNSEPTHLHDDPFDENGAK